MASTSIDVAEIASASGGAGTSIAGERAVTGAGTAAGEGSRASSVGGNLSRNHWSYAVLTALWWAPDDKWDVQAE